jgi:hypothetical protein
MVLQFISQAFTSARDRLRHLIGESNITLLKKAVKIAKTVGSVAAILLPEPLKSLVKTGVTSISVATKVLKNLDYYLSNPSKIIDLLGDAGIDLLISYLPANQQKAVQDLLDQGSDIKEAYNIVKGGKKGKLREVKRNARQPVKSSSGLVLRKMKRPEQAFNLYTTPMSYEPTQFQQEDMQPTSSAMPPPQPEFEGGEGLEQYQY